MTCPEKKDLMVTVFLSTMLKQMLSKVTKKLLDSPEASCDPSDIVVMCAIGNRFVWCEKNCGIIILGKFALV